MRNSVIVLVIFLGACVSLKQIQETQPVRTLSFKGSHTAVAKCVKDRTGGKLQDEAFGERHIIYNSVKGRAEEGLTHYAITISRRGPDEGLAEWRILKPIVATTGGRLKDPPPMPLADAVVRELWNPVVECAAQPKPRAAQEPFTIFSWLSTEATPSTFAAI